MSYSQTARLLWGTVRPQDWLGLQFSHTLALVFASSALPKANPVCLLGARVSWMPWHVLSGDQVGCAPSRVSAPIKKKKNTQIYRKQNLPFRRPPARQYSPELGYRGGSGLSDMQGEGPVKHRPPMRAPRAAVAARKWPFTPVLRADWNALRSTGLSAPRAADRSPALPRT